MRINLGQRCPGKESSGHKECVRKKKACRNKTIIKLTFFFHFEVCSSIFDPPSNKGTLHIS